MSIAAAQANIFYREVSSKKSAFTFLDDESFLVFPVAGQEVVPFWSTRSRVLLVQRNHPKYARFGISEVPLEEFLANTLPQLEEEGIRVGLNWSGQRLVGYDLSVVELRKNLDYWLHRGINGG